MKIDKVIFASDDNPTYLEFWKIVSNVCYNRLGIQPVLIHITNEDSDIIEDENGFLVKKIKRVDNINTGFQAQNARFWAGTLFPDDVCLTSDIDMLMLNKDYFVNQVKDLDNDSFVIYTSDAYGNNKSRYPLCYNAAKGKLFKQILNCEDDFSVYINKLYNINKDWSFDELYFTAKLNSSNYDKIVYLKRGWDRFNIANYRIDRIKWNYEENIIDQYIDCHCLRPIQNHKNEIKKLLNDLKINLDI